MPVSCGIIGLAGVGKTELFNLLTGSAAARDTRIGTAKIPDSRLDYLAGIYQPKKVTYAGMEMIELPGLEASKQGQKQRERDFMQSVRRVDALIHVVRAFGNEAVWHEGGVDVVRDLEEVDTELVLEDLQLVETRMDRIQQAFRKGLRDNEAEYAALEKCKAILESEKPLKAGEFSQQEEENLQHMEFLTTKPVVLVLNVDEKQLENGDFPGRDRVLELCRQKGYTALELNAELEREINELEEGERADFLEELGIDEPGIAKTARAVWDSLGLITFLTVGKDEVRAWTIAEGTGAREAAGKIHSDIERGFIRAEVISFEDFHACGSEKVAKEKGFYRLEGKEYVVKDGDIINFRFNV